ncbi:hypothetical protein GCM10009304_33090 [Pseudomonas matsuisoli]|uniref:Uncharacterized protein n=1 Tax=Pseudomonas matsuisoli TaxID=1515666 RepID=A0A917Q0W6_9PSED|nr:hypothetical protein GCM10009304_33090 [Pseudomonas matsuisoli]
MVIKQTFETYVCRIAVSIARPTGAITSPGFITSSGHLRAEKRHLLQTIGAQASIASDASCDD